LNGKYANIAVMKQRILMLSASSLALSPFVEKHLERSSMIPLVWIAIKRIRHFHQILWQITKP